MLCDVVYCCVTVCDVMLSGWDRGWLRPRRSRHRGARGLRGGQEEVRQRADLRGGALNRAETLDRGMFDVSHFCSLFIVLLVINC